MKDNTLKPRFIIKCDAFFQKAERIHGKDEAKKGISKKSTGNAKKPAIFIASFYDSSVLIC